MIALLPHPSARALERAVDDELAPRDADLVTRHLTDCGRCAEHVTRVRALGERARGRAVPPTAEGLVGNAIARRAAGERVLLPVEQVAAPVAVGDARSRARRWLVGATAVVAAATAVVVFTLAGPTESLTAGAAASALQFTPLHPRAGQAVAVTYHASARMPESGPLVLRAQYWDTGATIARDTVVVAATLLRAPDGAWRGGFALPSTFEYGVFAVEDTAGSVVDFNLGGLYDLVPAGATGQPTLTALLHHSRVLQLGMGYDTTRRRIALAATRDITDRYPQSPRGWAMRAQLEGTEPTGFSIVRAWLTRWRRLSALDAALQAQRHPNAIEMLALAKFAASLEEPETADKWYARVLADSTSDDPEVVGFRLGRLARQDGLTPDRVVVEYEEIATQRPTIAPLIYYYALQAAVRTRDSSAFVRVLNACGQCADVLSTWSLRDIPPLRHAVIPRLRTWLAEDRPMRDAQRLLGYTRNERVQTRARWIAQRHQGLGALLAFDDRPREAIAEFETAERLARAARLGPGAISSNFYAPQQLRAYLAVGDTADALRVWARTAVVWNFGMYQKEMLATLAVEISAARREAALAEMRPVIEAERAAALPDPDWRRGWPLPLTFRYYYRGL